MISRERRDRIKAVLINYPAVFRAVRSSYITFAQFQREVSALFHFAPQLAGLGRNETAWHGALPVQKPQRIDAGKITPTLNPQQVKAWCTARQLAFMEGPDALYLPPQSWRSTPLGPVLPEYPADAGLKIVKYPGNSDAPAGSKQPDSSRRLQTLTFNRLHLQGIAPRLYDLIEISDGSRIVWTAYVVAHVNAAPLQPRDCQTMIERLRSLEGEGLLKVIADKGWSNADFQPPDCNGKMLRDENGRLVYVDTQNFALEGYGKYLRDLALSVKELSHFGGRCRLLGGKSGYFLYQEFPGLDQPAKRSPRARLQGWDPLLQRAGLSLEGRTVFDVGCNLGLMGAEYLRRGVRWVHGWDRPEVIEAAHKVLLSVGCTRFSLTGGLLDANSDLFAHIPDHLKEIGNDSAIVSYLAVREHIGWLPGLTALPWRYMLYEGHQDDHPIETYIAELNKLIPVRLLTTDRVSDGVVGTHDIAVIERLSFK